MKISDFPKYIFWSYNPDADLPEEIIIEQVCIYGDIQDILKLTQLFDKEKINAVLKKISPKYKKRINFIKKVIL